jgi:hypothetical protein
MFIATTVGIPNLASHWVAFDSTLTQSPSDSTLCMVKSVQMHISYTEWMSIWQIYQHKLSMYMKELEIQNMLKFTLKQSPTFQTVWPHFYTLTYNLKWHDCVSYKSCSKSTETGSISLEHLCSKGRSALTGSSVMSQSIRTCTLALAFFPHSHATPDKERECLWCCSHNYWENGMSVH